MTYKQIESSRERRLWLKDIFIPLVMVVAYVFSKPENKCWIRNKWNNLKVKTSEIKTKIKNKFKKG